MTDDSIAGPAPADALEPGEVPAGYTARGGTDRCDECVFFRALAQGPDGSAPGECLVHGAPPYIVDAGGWCPAWEPDDGLPPL